MFYKTSICRLPVDTTMAMYTCNVITVTTINDPTTSKIQNTDLLFFMLIDFNYSYDDWPPQYEWLTHNLSESIYKIDFHFTKPCCTNAIVWFVSWSICSWPISTKHGCTRNNQCSKKITENSVVGDGFSALII